ncbi:CDP-alcohol phosphatidyltransferase family protein [bacterium]|nr:CDP-alcohol phosphatidyltransferase family protein [bacterium]
MSDAKSKQISEDRVQTSFLAKGEKKVLIWMGERTPKWITPDILTYLGLAGMIMSGIGYYLAFKSGWFLHLASLGLFINWVGDSLDGTLARVRKQERPKFGYYLDHLIDAFGIAALIFGLAYSGMAHQPFVWLFLSLFFIASINVYLATHTIEIFKISYLKVSTTEARVILILMNTFLVYVKSVTIAGKSILVLDIIAALGILFLFIAIIRSAYKNLSQLDRQERAKWDKAH